MKKNRMKLFLFTFLIIEQLSGPSSFAETKKVVLDAKAIELEKVSNLVKVEFNKPKWNFKNGKTEDLEVDIPKSAISFSIFAYSSSEKDYFVVDSVIDPKGKVFVYRKAPASSLPQGQKDEFGIAPYYSPNKSVAGQSPGYVGLLIPNNPKLSITPGKWKFSVASQHFDGKPSQSPPKILVVIKTKLDGRITKKTQGKVNMYFQFTGSDGLSTATFEKDQIFQNQIRKLQEIYLKVGIKFVLRDAKDIEFPEQVAEFGTLPTFNLFKKGMALDGINFIFVSNILLSATDTAQGLSGALLGPQLIPGVAQNGTLVITTPVNPNYRRPPMACVMAHEAGHYLGLPHNFDNDGSTDPFSDTPDKPFSKNLMSSDISSDVSDLSAEQRYLLMLSPAVTLFETKL